MSSPRKSSPRRSVTRLAIDCATIAVVIAIGMLLGALSRKADTPSVAGAALHESVAPSDLSAVNLYKQVAPSVVTIIVKDETGQPIGSGSGFFIDQTLLPERYGWIELDKQYAKLRTEQGTPTQHGYVVTNYHVIRPAVEADVVLFNGDEGNVSQVIAEDKVSDLALLSVDVTSKRPPRGIPLAHSDPAILTTVYAIGSPKGLQGSASEGKVSAYRELPDANRWLQTTTPISEGSSGGPLLLVDGLLVGVTTVMLKDAQNLNFAIPVSRVQASLFVTPFWRRDVAEGASIRWEEKAAFGDMRAAIEVSQLASDWKVHQYTAAEKKAVALLEQARQKLRERALAGEEPMRQAVALAEEANKSLPDEYKYLAHYIAGTASHWAAVFQVGPKTDYATEREALYQASNFGRAARRYLAEATRLRPDFSPAYESLLLHYQRRGDWADALVASNTLVRLVPRCAEALSQRAKCYSELDQPDSAKDDLKAAIDLSPRDASLHFQLANVVVDLAEFDEAIISYKTVLELCDTAVRSGKLLSTITQYELGIAYRKAGDFGKAISAFTKAQAMGWNPDCDQQIAKCRQQQR